MRISFRALVLGAIAILPLAVHASYVTNVSLDGDFAITDFNPAYDTDSNSSTFELSLMDLNGIIEVQVPIPAAQVTWTMTGMGTADIGGAAVFSPITTLRQPIGEMNFGGQAPGDYRFDFSNQAYPVAAETTMLESALLSGLLPSFDSTLFIDSQITALDTDGLLNDMVFSMREVAENPLASLSAFINFADMLPSSGQPGIIDGQFSLRFMFEGEATPSVSEPQTLGLLGLGLAGILAFRRRRGL